MYRKVPVDLLEGTKRGSLLSSLAILTILILFGLETRAFLRSQWTTSLKLDDNEDPRIRLNFNITMLDLKCDFAVLDVVSVLGDAQNVSAHVTKWQLDGAGIRQRFQGARRRDEDLMLKDEKVTETIEELHENGEDAISVDEVTFEYALHQNEYLFVDFYAGWCSHCRDLAPTYEKLAEVMNDAADRVLDEKGHDDYTDEEYEHARAVERPVMIAKVDCVDHRHLCIDQQIRAYPTLRLFVEGEKHSDYRGHRTVMDMTDWLRQVEEEHKKDNSEEHKKLHLAFEVAKEHMGEEERDWNDRVQKRQREFQKNRWMDEDHPGCQMAGHLMLNRVPGNFHIQARSLHHDLVPHMTNVSHIIHQLFIGEPLVKRMVEKGDVYIPEDVKEKLSPMNDRAYITRELHEAHHHYLKVITTNMEGLTTRHRRLFAYQILQNSQLAFYRNDVVPEAKFMFDLSPISVSYSKRYRHWYDYITSVMAIVGGTFTVVGLLEGGIHAAVSRKKRY